MSKCPHGAIAPALCSRCNPSPTMQGLPQVAESPNFRKHDAPTAVEAGKKVNRGERRRVVEEVFRKAYPGDLANEEVAQLLDVKDGSISSRVSELRKLGVLEKTARRHKSEDGGSQGCHVWIPPDEREHNLSVPDEDEL